MKLTPHTGKAFNNEEATPFHYIYFALDEPFLFS